jgi:hypothetical protein
MSDGSPIPDALNKMAVVLRNASGVASRTPHVGYIINKASFFDSIENLVNSTIASGASASTVTLNINFNMYSWTALSDTDKAEFSAWVRSQIMDTFRRASFAVSQVQVTLSEPALPRSMGTGTLERGVGGVDAAITITMSAQDTSTVLAIAVTAPAELLGVGGSTVSLSSGTTEVVVSQGAVVAPTCYVLPAKPPTPVLTVAASSAYAFSFDVGYASATQTISAVHVLTSTSHLADVLSADVVATAQASYTPAPLAGGPVSVSCTPDSDLFVYVVSTNSAGSLSDVASAENRALSMAFPGTAPLDPATGLRQLVVQTEGYGVQLKDNITVLGSQDAATAYLLLYASSNDVPPTAADTLLQVLGGAPNATGPAVKL